MSALIQGLKSRVSGEPRRVLLPEVQDPRVLEAARILVTERLATPVFLSEPSSPVEGAEVFATLPNCEQWQQRVDVLLQEIFAGKGAEAIEQARQSPLMRAAALLRLGYADAAVAGSVATTAEVLRSGLRVVGLAEQSKLVSSCFLMELGPRVVTFADCAVVPDPDPEQLAHIAIASASTHQKLTGEQARIAMLSFSTRGSAEHEKVTKVREAVTLVRRLAPELAVDGELQFDAAFVPEVASRKAPDSEVAGQANVMVFPDLAAANIGYKIAERVGGAIATGPILQGLKQPWMDLSRGCSAADIVNVTVIASILS